MATTEVMICNGDLPIDVAADYSAKQFYLFYINSMGRAEIGNASTHNVLVLQDKPAAAGRAGAFRMHGISKVILGGAVSPGDELIADSSGRAVNRGSTSGHVIGIALDDGAASDIGSVLLAAYHR